MTARRNAEGRCLRGTSNSNDRGSASERRRRKCWLLAWFGDGITAPCYCCGRQLFYSALEVDRIIPGVLGGTYARGNIRPVCRADNIRSGNAVKALIRAGTPTRTILRLCRVGDL